MQTPHFSKVKIQDTPIKTIRLEWREVDTDYSVEVPLSWAYKTLGFSPVTDWVVDNIDNRVLLLNDIRCNTAEWMASIRLEWAPYIASLACSDYIYPEVFAV